MVDIGDFAICFRSWLNAMEECTQGAFKMEEAEDGREGEKCVEEEAFGCVRDCGDEGHILGLVMEGSREMLFVPVN